MRRRCALFAALMLVLSAGSARAVVIDWTLGKLSVYLQSASNLAPSAPLLHEVYAQFASNDTDEFLAVALDGAPGGAVPLDAQPGGKRWDISLGFATAAQLEAAIPAGDYTLAAATATSTIRETVSLRPGSLDSIPYFTGSVFEILSGLNPAEPLRLEWNAPGVDVNQVTLHVDSLSGGQPPVAVDATGETSLTLAPGTLAPNTVYSLSIEFASEQPDQRDGFSAGEGKSVVKNLTEITFTTGDVPEPSGLLVVAALGTWVASRRRRWLKQR